MVTTLVMEPLSAEHVRAPTEHISFSSAPHVNSVLLLQYISKSTWSLLHFALVSSVTLTGQAALPLKAILFAVTLPRIRAPHRSENDRPNTREAQE